MTIHMLGTKQRAQIVLEGLKGLPLTELCRKHRIRESQYYEWRDQFLDRVPRCLRGSPQQTWSATSQTES